MNTKNLVQSNAASVRTHSEPSDFLNLLTCEKPLRTSLHLNINEMICLEKSMNVRIFQIMSYWATFCVGYLIILSLLQTT